MKIIPVLDLKNGIVVHARHGDREHYQAIQSKLCQSSNIYDVIAAFLSIYDFDTFYIADLNAISGQGNHNALINEILAQYPEKMFWLDQGYQQYGSSLLYLKNYLPVLGSESYQDDTVCELSAFQNRFILSLDYSPSGALGPESLFNNSDNWPDNIIIMSLSCVGSNQGPDLGKLSRFYKRYPTKNFIAAGGIRDVSDLMLLKQVGVQQALIASSLHAETIKREDIVNL